MKKGWISAKSPRTAEATSKTNVAATADSVPALPPKPKSITLNMQGLIRLNTPNKCLQSS